MKNNSDNVVRMFGTETDVGGLTKKKPHQVSLHMLGMHPLLQVVYGVHGLILDQDQLRHHGLKAWLVIK